MREELSPITRLISAILSWRHSISCAFAAAEIATLPSLAYACAMCGLPAGDHQAHAFNTSVLFMMLVPYSIVLIIGAVLFFSYRSARRRLKRQATAKAGGDLSNAVVHTVA